ncbi:MAG: hypothetical protein DYG89_15085 [Caldilinea sp. CFX5]|nr:hypothetical protein [Caldilinea sp. CFX5]
MKTIEEIQTQLHRIQDTLHLHADAFMEYYVGQITALMWTLKQRPSWVDCHIAANDIWEYSRRTRSLLLSVLPDQKEVTHGNTNVG